MKETKKKNKQSHEPVKPKMGKLPIKKGIYIIPSLFTCGNMTFGLLSIVASVAGDFIWAAWFLVGSLACDILDGRIARMTHATSEFGGELDSLSDLVAFGIAPAMIMYMLVLNTMGKLGIAITILFVLCAALRLARFNVAAKESGSKSFFSGLPTPAAAGIIISFVLSYELIGPSEYALNFNTIPILMETMPLFFKIMPVVMVVLSFLMVSNVPYYSFKKLHFSKPVAARLLVFVIVLIILIIIYPQNVIFIIFSLYVISGLFIMISHAILKRKRSRNKEN
ncbi:CDP-diacylglycerol--serine O-phosphatidyltransferase [Breznakiellaceae bacterium SP9]